VLQDVQVDVNIVEEKSKMAERDKGSSNDRIIRQKEAIPV